MAEHEPIAAQGQVWYPSDAFRAAANWRTFMNAEGLGDYPELERRATDDPRWFWDALLRHLGIRFRQPYSTVLDLSGGLPWPKWCVGGTMNMTETLLDRHLAAGRGEHEAVVWEGEDGTVRTLSYTELSSQVNRLASGIESLGLKPGDAVGIYLPMVPEVAIAFLALARVGCIVLPMFSGFGPSAIATRLNDAEAVALICEDFCMRRGRRVDMLSVAVDAAREVPTLRHLVVARRNGERAGPAEPEKTRRDTDGAHWQEVHWARLIEAGSPEHAAQEVAAEHPLMIVYTSGTSGKPKGTVHTHCGLTAKTGEDFLLCFDLKPQDRLLWMTDFGWLVGPLQVTAALLAGATVVLVEGAPDYPETGRLWRLVARHRVSFLGIGPTVARMMKRHAGKPCRQNDLSCLRVAASTGEPWDPDSWTWVCESVLDGNAPLMNYSGGTEVGGLLATNVLYPIKPASFSGPIPGTGADIVDEQGNSLAPGQVGELVMRQACIGMTRGLWRDPGRYLDSYWRRIPGMWVHGDWASRDADGSWFIHGRSDDTIKIAGKRTGPAEIEALLLATHMVSDAAAVAIPDPVKGAALVCVVIPADGARANARLRSDLAHAVVSGLGSSFRPKRIVFSSDLPRTRNLKTMRRVVRAALLEEDPGDLSTLMNPEAVDTIRQAAKEEGA
ncbi:MAG TPA: AMP-binding protein [Rubrivivax sp.]|nr:AMP-binding protein [Rubrivivax sp.]